MQDTPKVTLADYHAVVVNSSGGKDSQTALREIVRLAERQKYPKDQIVVSHQDLGDMEWPDTKELVCEQAGHYDLPVIISKYRNKQGKELTLLDYIRRRKFWPSNKQRYCTSEFKRGPGSRVLTMVATGVRSKLGKGTVVRLLQVFGFRAQESTSRAKKLVFCRDPRNSRGNQQVDIFLPIHHWTEEEVWRDIGESGVPHHPAYDLGMPRLSCSFCIFAPRGALLIAGRARPEMLQTYVELEKEIGHTFQNKKPLADIQAAIAAGEQPDMEAMRGGCWNM